jgi:serine/threonine protein kinase
LKADNILLHNSLFKIADFGFSKTLQITNDEMIGTHTFLGTLSTMAPEVLAK